MYTCEVLSIFNTLQQKSLKLHLIFPHVELTDFGRTGLQAAGPSRSSPLGFSVSPDLSLLQRVEGTVSFGRGRDGGGGGGGGGVCVLLGGTWNAQRRCFQRRV